MTQRSFVFSLMFATLLVTGCGGSMRNVTADEIHCAPHDTIISEERNEMDAEMWTARCTGNRREYACQRDKSDDGQIHCAPR